MQSETATCSLPERLACHLRHLTRCSGRHAFACFTAHCVRLDASALAHWLTMSMVYHSLCRWGELIRCQTDMCRNVQGAKLRRPWRCYRGQCRAGQYLYSPGSPLQRCPMPLAHQIHLDLHLPHPLHVTASVANKDGGCVGVHLPTSASGDVFKYRAFKNASMALEECETEITSEAQVQTHRTCKRTTFCP
jgi:hypothetical protein